MHKDKNIKTGKYGRKLEKKRRYKGRKRAPQAVRLQTGSRRVIVCALRLGARRRRRFKTDPQNQL